MFFYFLNNYKLSFEFKFSLLKFSKFVRLLLEAVRRSLEFGGSNHHEKLKDLCWRLPEVVYCFFVQTKRQKIFF
jgi:hypothetical protein